MNCNEVDDLMGAYAADALERAEAQHVREHLRHCAAHAAIAMELRATVASLADSAEPMTPPVTLRSRILEAVAATETNAAPVEIGSARVRRQYPAWFMATAAAAAAIIVGLAVSNVVLLNRGGGAGIPDLARSARVVATLQAHDSAGGGVVLYFPDEKKALVVGDGMKPLDATASTYQLWEIDGGLPRSIGLMQADAAGHAIVVVPFEGGQGQTLAITIEPPGGSLQPTTAPIFTTKI